MAGEGLKGVMLTIKEVFKMAQKSNRFLTEEQAATVKATFACMICKGKQSLNLLNELC